MGKAPSAGRSNASRFIKIQATASALTRAPFLKLFRREPDCWRRILGLGLRSEGTRFGLATFGLRIPSNPDPSSTNDPAPADDVDRFIRHFSRFISHEPAAHFVLKHHRHHVERLPAPHVDLVRCDFSPEGGLVAIKGFLDPRAPLVIKTSARQAVENAILLAHRLTRQLSDTVRSHELSREVQFQIASNPETRLTNEPGIYAARLLSACAISCTSVFSTPRSRFLSPDFRLHRGFGASCFDVVLRSFPNNIVDVWLNIHHTAADGSPMQEILTRLELAWGGNDDVRFPAHDATQTWFIQACQTSLQDRPISLLTDFLDLTSLVNCRSALNARLAAKLGSPVPLAGMLLWILTKEPEFNGRKFSTPIDVPADQTWPRGVDLISIRPRDYFDRPDDFVSFIRDYIERVNAGRVRRSPTYGVMKGLSFVSPGFAQKILVADPDRVNSAFGSVGLSVLRDAKVFIAPMTDTGFGDGFMALGNLSLPTVDGRTVGVLTVKGEPDRIVECANAFRRALNKVEVAFGLIA